MPPGLSAHVLLLRKRCNVKYQSLNRAPKDVGESVFKQELEYWNIAMMAELERQHGHDFLSKPNEEAFERRQTLLESQRNSASRTPQSRKFGPRRFGQ
ncbi:hypothetical protein Poly59_35980 [Rubripirellula reticaptiva]|uniref:Uncharacterized protein n=1 Tax=Rubripirellula reticaptiva TaxID=2528013 RepID=A0A5C6EXQ9_9BACT|nr:hypothetical protein Poly59_35980 [Rubripirellula reticaptiva]